MATEEVNKPPSLPSYPEMVMKAIEALNEQNGSNKSSISKYIEATYSELPDGHSTLLAHHLNKMKDSGDLVFWKNNYSKPDPNAPPRRGRGRPPKPKEVVQPIPEGTVPSSSRPRGRPPKDSNAPPKSPKSPKATSGTGKPRGRPSKMAKPAGGLAAHPKPVASSGRPRGRPPKVKPQQLPEVSVQ